VETDQRLDNAAVAPSLTGFGDIGLEQDPRLQQPARRTFPFSNESLKLFAFLAAQPHNISLHRWCLPSRRLVELRGVGPPGGRPRSLRFRHDRIRSRRSVRSLASRPRDGGTAAAWYDAASCSTNISPRIALANLRARQLGAEGIASKKIDGTSRSGPYPVWIKVGNPALRYSAGVARIGTGARQGTR
jgi:hypothetical protein